MSDCDVPMCESICPIIATELSWKQPPLTLQYEALEVGVLNFSFSFLNNQLTSTADKLVTFGKRQLRYNNRRARKR